MKRIKTFQPIYTIMKIQNSFHYNIYHTQDENELLENILTCESVTSADVISTIDIGGNQIENLDDGTQRSTVRIKLEDNDKFKNLDEFLRERYVEIWFDH